MSPVLFLIFVLSSASAEFLGRNCETIPENGFKFDCQMVENEFDTCIFIPDDLFCGKDCCFLKISEFEKLFPITYEWPCQKMFE